LSLWFCFFFFFFFRLVVAELLLTPDAALSNQHRIEERLNEIARQDASDRPARPAPRKAVVSVSVVVFIVFVLCLIKS
jgi:hypothetical protein